MDLKIQDLRFKDSIFVPNTQLFPKWFQFLCKVPTVFELNLKSDNFWKLVKRTQIFVGWKFNV